MTAVPEADVAPRLLVLWDIDHTLIETRGVGRKIYDRAFLAATGGSLAELAAVAGRTELDIMSDSLRLNGVEPSAEAVARLAHELVREYEVAHDELAATGRALPGARETLAALAAEPYIHQSVLSGNLRAVARIKLEVFGLADLLDLQHGAYGDDHASRPELVRIAQRRTAASTGVAFGSGDTVLVGDTPNDITAAITAGVRVVGVASGKSDLDELRAAGADIVFPGLVAAGELAVARQLTHWIS